MKPQHLLAFVVSLFVTLVGVFALPFITGSAVAPKSNLTAPVIRVFYQGSINGSEWTVLEYGPTGTKILYYHNAMVILPRP